jgi:U1 small nuclear ribonucleoprotein 70kDa
MKTLFVGRLAYNITEAELRQEFEHYGAIKQIALIKNKKTGKPRGYAFVEFEHSADLKDAFKSSDGRKLCNRRIVVDVERGRTVKNWKPRRLAGGLGGSRIGSKSQNTMYLGREPVQGIASSSAPYSSSASSSYSSSSSSRDYRSSSSSSSSSSYRSSSDRDRPRDRSRSRERDRFERDRERDRGSSSRRDRSLSPRRSDRDRDSERYRVFCSQILSSWMCSLDSIIRFLFPCRRR